MGNPSQDSDSLEYLALKGPYIPFKGALLKGTGVVLGLTPRRPPPDYGAPYGPLGPQLSKDLTRLTAEVARIVTNVLVPYS